MMKKLVLLSTFVGLSASVPMLIQSNPDLVASVVAKSEAPQQTQLATVGPIRKRTVQGPLSGRSHAVRIDEQGHFRDEFRLNGRRVKALIDTGATLVAINSSTARRIGIKLQPSDYTYEVNTANGKAKAAAAMIDLMQIGRIEVRKVKAVILDDTALSGTLVGMSFLKRLDSFAVQGNTLQLEQ